MYIDSHAHYDLMLEDRQYSAAEINSGDADEGLISAVQISIEPAGYEWSRKFAAARTDKKIYFTAGIHPSSPAGEDELKAQKKFVDDVMISPDAELLFGIGECGLDFYRMKRPADEQMNSLERQIGLAKEYGLPVIIHSRDAMNEMIQVLRRTSPSLILMHCFPGDAGAAAELLDLGAFISFAGNLTYPKAAELHESAAFVPLDRILFETDAPFLTPVPNRGRKNIPAFVKHTYEFAAALKKIKPEFLAERAAENFKKLSPDGRR